jgi:predicted metallo-beta-lactamase superfamily hydrolase
MSNHIHVVPLAGESLGTRSMCCYVETPDVRILLDAGVSLCPKRFGLPPHSLEFKAIDESRRRIAEAADKATVVTVSHYHFDHHTPSYEDWLCNWTEFNETAKQIYNEKTVLVKNPRSQINYSQRRRGWMFKRTGGKHAKKLETADGKSFSFGETKIKFSDPVFHGPENTSLGWVLMTVVQFRDEKFMFAPDVQGPTSTRTLELITEEKPNVMMIGGPPLYLVGFKVSEFEAQSSLKNLEKIAKRVPSVILEHHVLRDENWLEKTAGLFGAASSTGCSLLTAAEFLGKQNIFLEAHRKKLFIEEPPTKDYAKWMSLSEESRKHTRPPI